MIYNNDKIILIQKHVYTAGKGVSIIDIYCREGKAVSIIDIYCREGCVYTIIDIYVFILF